MKLEPTTISFGGWFYLPSTDSGDTNSQTLIDKGVYSLTISPHSTAANQVKAIINTFGDSDLTTEAGTIIQTEDSVNITGDVVVDRSLTSSFTPNSWNHIWVTWGTPNLKLYINNSLVSSSTNATGVMQTNSNNLIIG